MASPPDEELLRAWRGGDPAAGNALIERHFKRVYRFFRRRLPELAEDLSQRTFLALAEADADAQVTSVRAYVLGIAKNLLYMELRRRYRKPEAGDEEISQLVVSTRYSPSKVAARRRERELLLAAMQALPVEQQLVLELHYWEQMSTREIAEVLGVPAGTVKWRLSRARSQLEEQLRASEGQPPQLVERTLEAMDELVGSAEAR